jgi:hypothetical protein
MFEKFRESEFSETEQALIVKLREKGPDDPDVHGALLSWCKNEEAKVDEINTSRASIEFNLKRAKLYRAAGYGDDALENLESVREAARNEGAEDLCDEAAAIMDEIDNERPEG